MNESDVREVKSDEFDSPAERAVANIALTLQVRGFDHEAHWLARDTIQATFCDGHLLVWLRTHYTHQALSGKRIGQQLQDAARLVSGAKSVVLARSKKASDKRGRKKLQS